MANPVWIRPVAGDLGKIESQRFYELQLLAEDPENLGTVTYKLIAGALPKGLQVSPNGFINGNPDKVFVLQGVPFSVNEDVTSTFTVRAYNNNDNTIADRTFSVTVTNTFPPTITTKDNPLGTFLDGTEVNLQLEAIDLNGDDLEWQITEGILPPGLALSSAGLISGLVLPQTSSYQTSVAGWNNARWNGDEWEFAVRGSFEVYNFTVSVTDGKFITTQNYRVNVYAYNDLRADNISITADTDRITADLDNNRPPILLTKDFGSMNVVNSGGYFAFKFDGIDYDGYPVDYNIDTGTSFGWDGNLNWDMGEWDRDNYILPPGLHLDSKTGWLTGYIPLQPETSITYTFGIYVSSTVGDYTESATRIFQLTTLGNLDLAVSWITDSDLGSINIGAISTLSVQALAASGRELTYSLDINSKLPQGLKLLSDGTFSGRVSFQRMSYDQGTTTFDKELATRNIYQKETNFDNIYSFTVTANDYNNEISASRTFTIRINPITYEPYENLFIRCLPSAEKRLLLDTLINNTDIFDPEDIYRPLDPYYGLQREIKFLVSYGLKASKLSDYINAMATRHFNKKFFFGNYKVATAKDTDGNELYDVVYVDLIEDTKVYQDMNGVIKKLVPKSSTNINKTKSRWKNPKAPFLKDNQLKASADASVDSVSITIDNSYYLKNPLNEIFPNDLTLMQVDIARAIENTYLNSLPQWMISIQDNNQILGYTSGAPLAYLKPGTGEKALFRLKKYAPFDIKMVPFVSDRYVLNNSYTSNFDIEKRKFIPHRYTTFDLTTKGGAIIEPVTRVDFAVDRPFDTINNQSLDYIISTGGFDGVTYNLDKKYMIFSTQEAYIGWGTLVNDGWNNNQLILGRWDDTVGWDADIWDKYTAANNVLVPGYLEKTQLLSLTNQRGGVWQININSLNYVELTFVREIMPGDYVYVNQGNTHSNSFQLYDLNALSEGFTVPNYKQSFNAVLQPRPRTTFDYNNTQFINNVDNYTLPFSGDKYLKFPKIGVFTNG